MTRRSLDTTISATALVIVAVLVASPVGAGLRRAEQARNAATVSGIAAGVGVRPGRLVPLNARARLPRRALPLGNAVRGRRGPDGPAGALGPAGPAGAEGPGRTVVVRGRDVRPMTQSTGATLARADDLPAGTYLALTSVQARRDGTGAENLVHCRPSNGLVSGTGAGGELGKSAGGGEQQLTLFGIGVFSSDRPQDIAIECGAAITAPPAVFSDATLIVVAVPAVQVHLGSG